MYKKLFLIIFIDENCVCFYDLFVILLLQIFVTIYKKKSIVKLILFKICLITLSFWYIFFVVEENKRENKHAEHH